MTPRRKSLVRTAMVVCALAVGAAFAMREPAVTTWYRPDDAPAHEVAIVLGAKPGQLLTQRMDAACALFSNGRVGKLVLTGLAEEMPYMLARAQQCGATTLVDDQATRTLENLRNARDKFGVTRALVVTQEFHLPRALYLARALGIDATGVIATGAPRSLAGRLRERVATARARIDVALL
jgi:vancomycin permeability regulator SanA